jgi:formate dehydrogenase assembly factor FdhD
VRIARRHSAIIAVAGMVLLAATATMSNYVYLMSLAMINVIAAIGLNLLTATRARSRSVIRRSWRSAPMPRRC